MKKSMVYFVLYIVILVELLIVITERDDLEKIEHEIRDKMISSLARSYSQPIVLQIPQRDSDYSLKNKEPHKIVMAPAGLVSDEEKQKVKYFIDVAPDSKRKPAGWPDGGITSFQQNGDKFVIQANNGNAVFMADFKNVGSYKFVAYCEVERELPGYLTDHLLEQLKEELHYTGENEEIKSEVVDFSVNVSSGGGVKTKAADVLF